MDKKGYSATQIRKMKGGFDGDAVRKWYKSNVDAIDINVSLTEANARSIVGQRNTLKQQVRDLMSNQKATNNLPTIESYDYYYNKSYNKGLRGEALYKDIINGGKKRMLLVIKIWGVMLGLFKKINRVLCEPLTWNIINGEKRKYSTDKYPKEECWIQMNDFPEEPLWTLFYKGDSIDIEDTPTPWKVNYTNDEPLI